MENDKKHKSFGLSNLALGNQISVFLIAILLIVAGIGVYFSLPKELFPEISFPQVYVSTPYPGNSPLDIENLISRPLEKELKSVEGAKHVKSTNVQDFSAIIVEFNTDVDIDKALQDVKDAVDKAKKDLPNDLDQDPQVLEVNASEFPIMNINFSGDFSIDELKSYAEYMEDEVETISQIDKAEIKGALDREISVNIDLAKMELNQVSFNDIEGALANENMTISGGDVLMGSSRRTIRTDGEFENVQEMENLIVKWQNNEIVYLRDIAEVVDGYEEEDSYARLYGYPVVTLDVVKKSGENLLEATDQIGEMLEKAKKERFPETLEITITNDQSEQTRKQINNLENSIILGVLLVVIVLLFFLGVRNALFVGLAIPLSMFLSFIILNAVGLTLNLVVLFSLVLALGMLVDNGIVTVENIYRLYEQGYSPLKAARYGVGEVAMPIISSTATTLAAFFPLLFWDDLMGEFMKFLPMTLITVLGSSLFVALVINPVVAAKFIKHENEQDNTNTNRILLFSLALTAIGVLVHLFSAPAFGSLLAIFGLLGPLNIFLLKPGIHKFQTVVLPWLDSGYEKLVEFSLKGMRPVLFLVAMIFLLVGSVMFYFGSNPKTEFFPSNEPKYINVFMELPIGTDINETDAETKRMEAQVMDILKPYESDSIVTSVTAFVGQGTADPNEGPQFGNTPHKARITISFVEFEDRKGISTSNVMKQLTSDLNPPAGMVMSVKKNKDGPPTGNPINLEVIGEDLDSLIKISERLKTDINNLAIPGIEELKLDIDLGKPEMVVDIDRSKARSFGLSTAQVGVTLRTALFGKEVTKYKDGEDDYPVVLKLQREYRYDVPALMNQKITFRNPANGRIVQVPISAVSDYSYTSTVGSVKRKDLDRVITVYSNVEEGFNATSINQELKDFMQTYSLPTGYEYKFTGEQEQQADSMAFLVSALLIAVAIIVLILVSQFNSIVKPVIIVLSVVFSLIGVFLGLAIFQMPFVVMMTGIGVVSLAGIVVNNSIVLIDYIDILKNEKRDELGIERGKPLPFEHTKKAVAEAGKTRLRPVLLTAITTVLGLIPLAIGMNIDFIGLLASFEPGFYVGGDNALFWGPMAWTVIYGLTFATFLTLIVVPSMYVMFENVRNFFIRK